MAEKIKFYMSRYADGVWEQEVELTERFPGLLYCKCEGLSSKGEVKNVYTESYAESEELRLYLPETPVRKSTEIKLTIVFSKDNRRDTFDGFVNFITGKRLKYWDTVRNREVEMIQTKEIELDEDIVYGSAPYIAVEFSFTNLKGNTKKHI